MTGEGFDFVFVREDSNSSTAQAKNLLFEGRNMNDDIDSTVIR